MLLGVGFLAAYVAYRRGALRPMAHYTVPGVPTPWIYSALPWGVALLVMAVALPLFGDGDISDSTMNVVAVVLIATLLWILLRSYRPVPDRLKPAWLRAEEQAGRRDAA